MSTLERKQRGTLHGSHGHIPDQEKIKPKCWCCRKMFSFFCSNFGLFALVISYSYFGAYLFKHFEGPYETKVTKDILAMREKTILKLWNITNTYNVLYQKNWTTVVTQEIVKFQTQLVAAVKEGYDGRENPDSRLQQWSLSSAFLYSLTVITTIGYGNIAPRTYEGKLATIVYALVGIPIMLLFLTNAGNFFANVFRYIYRSCCKRSNGSHSEHPGSLHAHHSHHHLHDHYHVHHIALNDVGTNANSGNGSGGHVAIHCNNTGTLDPYRAKTYCPSATVCNAVGNTLTRDQYGSVMKSGTEVSGGTVVGCITEAETKMCGGMSIPDHHPCTGTLSRSYGHSTPHSTLLRGDHHHHHHSDHINPDIGATTIGVTGSVPNNSLPDYQQHHHHSHQQQQTLQQQQQFQHQAAVQLQHQQLHQQQQQQEQQESHNHKRKVTVPIIFCLMLINGYIWLGAAYLNYTEGWTFLDGFYFCFLTLSTIGFGNLAMENPMFNETQVNRKLLFCSGYLLGGMALIAMCFNLVQDQIVLKFRNCKKTFGLSPSESTEEDEEGLPINALRPNSVAADVVHADFDV